MKNICFLFLILIFSACQNLSHKTTYQRSEHSKIAAKITAKIAAKIEHETGLRLIGTGGGMMHHVRMMAMSFAYYGEIDIEQGRELVVYCVNEYLLAINTNEEIKPYLIHFPFTPKDVEIRIFVSKRNGAEVEVGKFEGVSEIDGSLIYYIKQPGFPSIRKVHEETYEEALAVLEMQGGFKKIHANIHSM